jgi:hypothetical protein
MSVYDTCVLTNGVENVTNLMQCISNLLEESSLNANLTSNGDGGFIDRDTSPSVAATTPTTTSSSGIVVDGEDLKSWLLLLTGAMVFFMQVRQNSCTSAYWHTTLLPIGTHPASLSLAVFNGYRLDLPWSAQVQFERRM